MSKELSRRIGNVADKFEMEHTAILGLVAAGVIGVIVQVFLVAIALLLTTLVLYFCCMGASPSYVDAHSRR